jgi:O-antigen/teichoic acid export membrane protein
MRDIGSKAKVGAVYITVARIAGAVLQILGTIVLARLIAPEGFGIVATGTLVIGFATKFGQFGFNIALVQRQKEVTKTHVNTLFTLDLAFKVSLFAIVCLVTPHISAYFDIYSLNKALPFIAFYMVLECFSTTPLTMMQREMDFWNRSLVLTSERLFTTVLAISMALAGLGFWSLIYSRLIGVTISGLFAARRIRWLPKITYNHEAARELFGFGFLVFLRNLFRYGAENIDYFFISKFLGVADLGFYEKSFHLMRLPQRRITKGINSVAFAAFSRIQNQPERVRKAFRKLVLTTSLASYPMLTGMAFVAPLLIPLTLGEKWTPSVIPLQIMCAAGIFYSTDPFLNSVLTATGFVRWTVCRRIVELFLVACGAFYGVHYGINGVAVAILVVSVLVMIIMLGIITRKSNITWSDYFKPQLPAIITSAGMLVVMFLITRGLLVVVKLPDIALLSIQVLTGTLTYIALHMLFRFSQVITLFGEISSDTKGVVNHVFEKCKFFRARYLRFDAKKLTP